MRHVRQVGDPSLLVGCRGEAQVAQSMAALWAPTQFDAPMLVTNRQRDHQRGPVMDELHSVSVNVSGKELESAAEVYCLLIRDPRGLIGVLEPLQSADGTLTLSVKILDVRLGPLRQAFNLFGCWIQEMAPA